MRPVGDDPEARATIGGNIRARRQARGWKLRSLADRAEITVSYLSDLERDRTTPSLPTLARLADALDCTTIDLLRGTDPYDAPKP